MRCSSILEEERQSMKRLWLKVKKASALCRIASFPIGFDTMSWPSLFALLVNQASSMGSWSLCHPQQRPVPYFSSALHRHEVSCQSDWKSRNYIDSWRSISDLQPCQSIVSKGQAWMSLTQSLSMRTQSCGSLTMSFYLPTARTEPGHSWMKPYSNLCKMPSFMSKARNWIISVTSKLDTRCV